MAQLDIQQKRGISPIWWILGLILLVLLLWWLFAGTDPEVVEAPGAVTPVTEPIGATTDPITDVAMLRTAGDAAIGRQVTLMSAPVLSVVSDKGFWVGTENDRAFVVRGNESSAATPPDGAVNAGQTVAVYGSVQDMPADLTQQTTAWNLQSTDIGALQGQPVYVQADSVRVLARP